MTWTPRYTPVLDALPPSVPFRSPESIERDTGRAFDVRLGANESAFGVSPAARAAMVEALAHAAWYGDPESHDLRARLAALHDVRPAQLLVGAGIDELLGVVARLVVEPGVPVVVSLGGYPTFNFHVAGCGGRLVRVPYRGDANDLAGLAHAARVHAAPLVYLANPDNPTGSWHDGDAVRAFLRQLPPRALLILDEAYAEFAPAPIALPPPHEAPRVVRMRTFSKAHGMAGLRIAYAVADAGIVAAADRIRNHFGVNRVAQAGALASLDDADFIAGVVREVTAGRAEIAALGARLGLRALPSATNFVALDAGDGARARRLLALLETRGVFVRMPAVPPLDRCIRVTVGTAADRARLAPRLADAVAAL